MGRGGPDGRGQQAGADCQLRPHPPDGVLDPLVHDPSLLPSCDPSGYWSRTTGSQWLLPFRAPMWWAWGAAAPMPTVTGPALSPSRSHIRRSMLWIVLCMALAPCAV